MEEIFVAFEIMTVEPHKESFPSRGFRCDKNIQICELLVLVYIFRVFTQGVPLYMYMHIYVYLCMYVHIYV